MATFGIVIHGGAGTILRQQMSDEKEKAHLAALQKALDRGYSILLDGGTALDAARFAVMSLEDDPLFNAGRGSVFARNGRQEMDASIMDGSTLKAGAVAAVQQIKNPIELAYAVMTKSEHVMMIGSGAEQFASMQGIATMPDEYFFTPYRYEQWKKMQEAGGIALDHNVKTDQKHGTVGAVALDASGNLAAATSTGGMTNKEFGRVGDSPIIGAGTYANNATCAISCTGHGEPFIRAVAAYDVSCLMEYKGLSLKKAMEVVVHDKLLKLEGEGGMIGMDAGGEAEMIFNSEGMYRGMKISDGRYSVAIYKS